MQLKKINEQAQLEAAQCQAIVDSMVQGLLVFNGDAELVTVNSAWLETHGFDQTADVPRQLAEFSRNMAFYRTDGTPLPATEWPTALAFSGQKVVNTEYHGRNIKTNKFWIASYNASPVWNARGEIDLVVITVFDLTRSRRIDKELHKASQLLRLVTDASLEILFLKDLDGRYLAMSNAGAWFLGKEVDDVLGKTDEDLFPADEVPRIKADDRRALAGGSWRFRETVIDHTGEKRLLSTTKAPFRDIDGNIVGVFAMTRDITAQSLLAQRSKQRAAIAELGQRALVEHDLQSLMEDLVQRVARLLDVEFCKVLELQPDGKNLLLRSGIGWREGLVGQAMVSGELESQAGYTLYSEQPVVVVDLKKETRFQGPALLHEHDIVSGLSCIIGGSGGRPYGVFGAHTRQLRRFSEDEVNFLQTAANVLGSALQRQKAEETLQNINVSLEQRAAERTSELEEFVYTVSHDLREPLRVMRSFADALIEDYGADLEELAQHYLQRIVVASERMNALIDDLLQYSQLSHQDFNLTSVSLSNAISDVTLYFDKEIQRSKAHIKINNCQYNVWAHRLTLERILQNLISNALKFVKPDQKPDLQITAVPVEDQIELSVIDQGIGIASEHQEQIFGVFERLHSNDKFPGTGAGLAIVRRAVQRMNGQCGVESKLNKGSRFWLRLPQAKRSEEKD